MDYLVCTLVIGAGATAVTELWAIVRKRLLGIPPPDYGLVGRWLAYLPRGRFRHDPIAATAPVPARLTSRSRSRTSSPPTRTKRHAT